MFCLLHEVFDLSMCMVGIICPFADGVSGAPKDQVTSQAEHWPDPVSSLSSLILFQWAIAMGYMDNGWCYGMNRVLPPCKMYMLKS